MNSERREQIRQTLKRLAAAHAATMELMETALSLLTDERSLDPRSFWEARVRRKKKASNLPQVDQAVLTVAFRGRTCFLGNTLLFRFIAHLARRPNAYLSYEDLLADVWEATRTDAAVRSVAKRLRGVLRLQGMEDLADAIDGSVPGHYALKLGS